VAGDGVGFEPPDGAPGEAVGFTIDQIRTIVSADTILQAIRTSVSVQPGWRVVRSFDATLMTGARASFAGLLPVSPSKKALDVRVFGSQGAPLKVVFTSGDDSVTGRSDMALMPATKRALDVKQLREQLGRLGGTSFALGSLDASGLSQGLFLPVSELNRLRQAAVEDLEQRLGWQAAGDTERRRETIRNEVAHVSAREMSPAAFDIHDRGFALVAETFSVEDALSAARAGATEVSFDPFLRHPAPPAARVKALAERLHREEGVSLWLRLPSIVRPAERRGLAKWLDLRLPMVTGHLGLVSELASAGHDIVADYAVNCFNQHTASEVFGMGARRIVLSVELTAEEMLAVSAPWEGRGFETVVYGRPEGMTIEHCVLSAAFDRKPTTCRDLCVRDHTNVELTDPAGYSFAVATDSACRNRLLHSRPLEGSEFIPRLWRGGIRRYRLLFNVAGDPVADLVAAYRGMVEALNRGERMPAASPRGLVGSAFTRGHFARAV
ncbi:MAG TPA: DUF3656 domain-containing protein, partial [Gemmatimonadaceae bacterium]|nr:DUF3656 domain-containing protein [Gemmatimonadaceae bacterium]